MPVPMKANAFINNPTQNLSDIIVVSWPANIGSTGFSADLTNFMNVGGQARQGPGTKLFSDAEVEVLNDSDIAFSVSFDNSSVSLTIIPGTVGSLKIPFGASKVFGVAVYQNTFQAHPAEVVSLTFFDETDIHAGFRPRTGAVNFSMVASQIGPGTLPPNVLIPANQVIAGNFQGSGLNFPYLFPKALGIGGASAQGGDGTSTLVFSIRTPTTFATVEVGGATSGNGILFQTNQSPVINVLSLGGQFSSAVNWMDQFGMNTPLIQAASINCDAGHLQSDGNGNLTATTVTITGSGVSLINGNFANNSAIFNNNGFRNRAVQINTQQIASTPTHGLLVAFDGTSGRDALAWGSNAANEGCSYFDDNSNPFFVSDPTLITGNQETGPAGFFGKAVAAGDVWGYRVNYKTVMTNNPTSITLTATSSTNCTASAANIGKSGFNFEVTATAAGAFDWYGTYTTVGN